MYQTQLLMVQTFFWIWTYGASPTLPLKFCIVPTRFACCLFNMYACSICMYVYALHSFLVPVEAKTWYQIKVLELEFCILVSHHVSPRKQTDILCQSSKCSESLSYHSLLCSFNNSKSKQKHMQVSSFGNTSEIYRIYQETTYKINDIQIPISQQQMLVGMWQCPWQLWSLGWVEFVSKYKVPTHRISDGLEGHEPIGSTGRRNLGLYRDLWSFQGIKEETEERPPQVVCYRA